MVDEKPMVSPNIVEALTVNTSRVPLLHIGLTGADKVYTGAVKCVVP